MSRCKIRLSRPPGESPRDQRTVPAAASRSKRSRTERRQQIIDATIEVLALRGYARITLTEIAKYAGLSQALVNFHFETKDQLLADTLEYLAEEYRRTGAVRSSAPRRIRRASSTRWCAPISSRAVHTVTAVRLVRVLGRDAESSVFQQICGAKNEHYNHTLEAICRALLSEEAMADMRCGLRVRFEP